MFQRFSDRARGLVGAAGEGTPPEGGIDQGA